MSEEKIYGIADKAWQVVVGCDPHMKCAPRCWARRTVARIVKCQEPVAPARAAVFQIALTPDGKQWSGKTFLDEAHLTDPMRWRKSALIATGFHGDIGRLSAEDFGKIIIVMRDCERHQFMLLTKVPADVFSHSSLWLPLRNVTIGCSVMDQADADAMREPMRKLARIGWRVHCWYEPAVGPVNWSGWDFLDLVIAGGESGVKARSAKPHWFRDTRDWCYWAGIEFRFKQWGEYGIVGKYAGSDVLDRVGKKAAGNLLDGVLHAGMPRFR